MQFALFEVSGGWGYEITDDAGIVLTRQEFDPSQEGRTLMTQEVAEQRAVSDIAGQGYQAVRPSRHISSLQFLQRLTPSERTAILDARETDTIVRDFLFMFQVAQFIDLDEPTNRQGLLYFASNGWIQPERVDELLA